MSYSFELEKYITVNYSVKVTEFEARDTNPDSPGFGPGVEASDDIVDIEIVITSESIIDHLTILGDLAANYSDEDISSSAMDDYEENHQPEPEEECDDREPPEFDYDSHYKDHP